MHTCIFLSSFLPFCLRVYIYMHSHIHALTYTNTHTHLCIRAYSFRCNSVKGDDYSDLSRVALVQVQ